MDKLEAVQKVLRFSQITRKWCEGERNVYFDDFDSDNVNVYEDSGLGQLADEIIQRGIEEGFLDDEDLSGLR